MLNQDYPGCCRVQHMNGYAYGNNDEEANGMEEGSIHASNTGLYCW
jgi:hypothetical protein